MTRVNANGDVDEFIAKQIVQKITDSTPGSTVARFTCKLSDQAITLQSRPYMRVDGKRVQVVLTTERRYSGTSCVATHHICLTIL